jgi:hypothetical protein
VKPARTTQDLADNLERIAVDLMEASIDAAFLGRDSDATILSCQCEITRATATLARAGYVTPVRSCDAVGPEEVAK